MPRITKLKPEHKDLLKQYAEPVAKFRKLCIEHGDREEYKNIDFRDFSCGFFVALNVKLEYALLLATICRYTLQYWEGESL